MVRCLWDLRVASAVGSESVAREESASVWSMPSEKLAGAPASGRGGRYTDVAPTCASWLDVAWEFDLIEFGDFKMVDHVVTTPVASSAWLKDPDDNTIALFQPA